MPSARPFQSVENAISTAAKWGNHIGLLVLLLLMLITVADVFLRYVFRKPILGTVELTEYAMVIIVSMAFARCADTDSHAKIDMLVSRFSPRLKTVVNTVVLIIMLGFSLLLTWRAFVDFQKIYLAGSRSTILEIPASPFHFILTVGFVLFCLVLIKKIARSLGKGAER